MTRIKCSQEAREKCPFDHPCTSDERAYFEEGSPCDKFNKSLIPPPQPTNADHIRSMTDEELRDMLLGGVSEDVCPDGCNDCDGDCEGRMLNWLKQPYKEEQ